ncbi:hypothetical protein [Alkalihalobacillus sp. BA299]|uniref:hypothetical protein n=1 Tax=Alkalihalobacillus sp. BA299 TaxID=2815938 RepID=UPI001ADB0C16|nr:hypothetical protein [Alkalihalobacillus sp. BA299]
MIIVRISHDEYGSGTVVEYRDNYIFVDLDDGEKMMFIATDSVIDYKNIEF